MAQSVKCLSCIPKDLSSIPLESTLKHVGHACLSFGEVETGGFLMLV